VKTTTASALLLAFFGLAFSAIPVSATERLRAGWWEITTAYAKGEPRTVKLCVGAEEAASLNGDERAARAYAEKKGLYGCKIVEYKLNGPSASYVTACKDMTLRATATYHGDTYEGERGMKKGSEPEVVSHFKAKRLGNCP